MAQIRELLKIASDMIDERAHMYTAPTPRLDAEMMLCHVLGVERLWLFLNHTSEVSDEDRSRFFGLVEERLSGRPIAYIIGEQEFMGLRFEVSEDVLIPRPDTEVLVEAVLLDFAQMREVSDSVTVRIADIGTGSGAIAISLAKLVKSSLIEAFDVSDKALAIAARNAESNGVAGNIRFTRCDILSCDNISFGDGEGEDVKYDAIVSNPPYIRSGEMDDLLPGVRDFEPSMALDGGKDGLVFYRKISEIGLHSLKKGGRLYFEVGHDQSGQVMAILEDLGYRDIRTKTDLQGFERVVAARL